MGNKVSYQLQDPAFFCSVESIRKSFSVRVEPRQFMMELVSTQGLFTTNEIEDYLRDGIVFKA